MTHLVIDIGNTRVKAAVFKNTTFLELSVFSQDTLLETTRNFFSKHPISGVLLSSVTNFRTSELTKIDRSIPFLELNSETSLPFRNLYTSPKSLGTDRIACVAGAVKKFANSDVLVIDAGTCITYDFVTADKEYLGGAISPGIQMRYRALHHFSAQLPLLPPKSIDYFIGNSTQKSIHSGVIHGIIDEIEGVISRYKRKYANTKVVLTGGDVYFLAKQLKSTIFALPNFALEGLNAILIHNREGW